MEQYNPEEIEQKIYKFWLENEYFKADNKSDKEPFVMVIPPPNVTGSLHMGHALNNTLQDILARWKKINNFEVCWVPGTDHAGIATQNVVERNLLEKGIDKHSLGRTEFLKKVWEWKKEYGNTIINQLKRLGSMCDWSRERFTMDKGLSYAVKKVFVSLYKEGLIYRDNYIVNWCPRCSTALSDLEVEHKEENGAFYYVKYPIINSDEYILIATTRPETMLGDTAVAVHPDDDRYKNFIGKKVLLPLVNKQIPIIEDNRIDPSFGTGAVKITPGHDPLDFLIGKGHNLETINILNKDATTNENCGKYASLAALEARKLVIKDLEEQGYLIKTEEYTHKVGHCYRCNCIIEPMISKQWFVKMKPLAKEAIEAVKSGDIRFIPKQWEKTYFEWMENVRDWCISRQIWWGHRIPVWYCIGDDKCKLECSQPIVSEEEVKECPYCGSKNIRQDEDVLDTWFSSALWPFSTLGWPDETDDLKKFYPTTTLVTGFDIIYFWVARMIVMGLHFMKKPPFKDVYIHALIRDEQGRKMSKSKGNVIDPLIMIDKYGADAMRFTLTVMAAQGRDIKLSEKRIEGYRHFMNKIFNASKFIMNIIDEFKDNIDITKEPDDFFSKWIFSKLSEAQKNADEYLNNYEFDKYASAVYQFFWGELCDWFIELSKKSSYSEDKKEREYISNMLYKLLKESLILLHPIIPHLTEELYQKLPETKKSIMEENFNKNEKYINSKIEEDMNKIKDIITGIRFLRKEANIPMKKEIKILIAADIDDELKNSMNKAINIFLKVKSIEYKDKINKQDNILKYSLNIGEIAIEEDDLSITTRYFEKIKKDIEKIEKEMLFLDKKLKNPKFIENAPPEIVEKVRTDKKNYEEQISFLKKLI